jgi:hypothetical protein
LSARKKAIVLKALLIVSAVALLFCLAAGWGSYALAPGGAYSDWTVQGVSHDWHRYQWFFQVPSALPVLMILGAFIALAHAIIVVPVVLVMVAILFLRFPRSKGRLLELANDVRFWIVILCLGFATGIMETIIQGRNPGVP